MSMQESLKGVPNLCSPYEGVWSGGQPSLAQFQAAAAAGISTIINLRPDSEMEACGIDERPMVESLGMKYVVIPVAGPGSLQPDTARALDAALSEAGTPVLVHCGSGNRVGALFALRAAWLQGVAPAQAVALGRAAGMTALEPAIRGILGA
jgi:uncharacterized protein (TIGR01244 family)